MCLPQHLNVDLAASGVAAEVKDLPRSITHVGSTSVAGEFKDLTTSVKYLNGSGFYLVAGKLRGLSATESYLDVGGGERLRSQVTSGTCRPSRPTSMCTARRLQVTSKFAAPGHPRRCGVHVWCWTPAGRQSTIQCTFAHTPCTKVGRDLRGECVERAARFGRGGSGGRCTQRETSRRCARVRVSEV